MRSTVDVRTRFTLLFLSTVFALHLLLPPAAADIVVIPNAGTPCANEGEIFLSPEGSNPFLSFKCVCGLWFFRAEITYGTLCDPNTEEAVEMRIETWQPRIFAVVEDGVVTGALCTPFKFSDIHYLTAQMSIDAGRCPGRKGRAFPRDCEDVRTNRTILYEDNFDTATGPDDYQAWTKRINEESDIIEVTFCEDDTTPRALEKDGRLSESACFHQNGNPIPCSD